MKQGSGKGKLRFSKALRNRIGRRKSGFRQKDHFKLRNAEWGTDMIDTSLMIGESRISSPQVRRQEQADELQRKAEESRVPWRLVGPGSLNLEP